MVQGSKIIITRKNDRRDRIGQALRQMGAEVFNIELLKFTTLDIASSEWPKILAGEYQWLVFTSSNGIISFFDQLQEQSPEVRLESKIAVFGERTAQTLETYGYQPAVVGQNKTAVTLAKALEDKLSKADQVLLLLGNLASKKLTEALSALCNARRLDVYKTSSLKTTQQNILEMVIADDYDLLIITSPSSYQSLKDNVQDTLKLQSDKVVCLGPTTEATLAKDHIVPVISAKPSDTPGLFELISARLNGIDKSELSIN